MNSEFKYNKRRYKKIIKETIKYLRKNIDYEASRLARLEYSTGKTKLIRFGKHNVITNQLEYIIDMKVCE